ncbi:3-hydroxy-3-methylglutaryl-coenzyme A reductase [Colletotrichum spaethianum]|uniref:hydroxymethylglutaryl-CoA reductase (NADPH) n=1 Tax=Colletotrichum spaethianum TaxID=700344 RepID=A0AA37PAR3_9PEZI|nr:3-hydroxy-3-methylglutaryl-coenzyme A reductase [Colletotrichum spaethianum]GKT48777.1 3-hydroxy-3-methylglutaryl-coenzyme A reductase [Colletotrichum spaethianum]
MNSSGAYARRGKSFQNSNASWLNKKVTPFLQLLPRLTSVHPIPVVTFVALLASFTYIVLLEDTLSSGADGFAVNSTQTDWSSLTRGSLRLQAAPDSNWTWRGDDSELPSPEINHLALLTLDFSGSVPANAASISDIQREIAASVTPLLPSSHSSIIDAQDTTLSFSVPYHQAPGLLAALWEIRTGRNKITGTGNGGLGEKTWAMSVAGSHNQGTGRSTTRVSVTEWVHNAYYEFMDILKSTQALDIVFMALGYISMILTFASLFLSMRSLGSKWSIAASVLISSFFAFLFGLLVTTKLFNTPITVRLLSEGLPFLVVLVGFEKNILLTQSVLSHAIEHKQSRGPSNEAQYAIETSIKERGFQIVRDYALEILVLTAGAFSNIQGGLQEFCFLAGWILCFDCILLFLFYAPILCIKLEINRIKRHIDIRSALEDDGISHRVAENVARSSDPGAFTIFGRQISSIRNIPNLKILLAGCFVLVNLANLAYMASIDGTSSLLTSLPLWSHSLGSSVSTHLSVDPFKVAPNGLDFLLNAAKLSDQGLAVTVLRPIKYELTYNFDQPGSGQPGANLSGVDLHNAGRIVAGSLLSSLEDPVLHKWIIGALSLSIAFNVYLFNAARWGIKDDPIADNETSLDDVAPRAEKTRSSDDFASALTPTETEDESELPMEPAESSAAGQALLTAPNENMQATQRTEKEMVDMHRAKRTHELSDDEVAALSLQGMIPGYALEKTLNFDFRRAVKVRRNIISQTKVAANLTYLLEQSKLPYKDYDWSQVFGACCENVIGYMPIPLGVAGPLIIDGKSYFIPMATTEGVLVASASRGAKAINAGGGAVTVLTSDGMTRGPCVGFKSLERAGSAKSWLDSEDGQTTMKKAFNSTSRFARLQEMDSVLAGTNLFIRFKASTADAMGMNMISKGVEKALSVMKDTAFEDMDIVTLTGNYCTDKKASAINWIRGRGKSVVAEAVIPSGVIKAVLKTDIDSLVDVFVNKNMIGSAMAGSIGGFNAQAANIVAAIFIATGQDPAQVVESANCITIMKRYFVFRFIYLVVDRLYTDSNGQNGRLSAYLCVDAFNRSRNPWRGYKYSYKYDNISPLLYFIFIFDCKSSNFCSNPVLESQGAVLDLLGVRGPHHTQPGANARHLARIIAAATLAGELSLCSALAAGHLVRAHMQHNRSAAPTRTNTPAPASGLTPRG